MEESMMVKINREHEEGNQPAPHGVSVECIVIYRCGWCGYPVQKDGQPLPEIKDNDDASEYLNKNEGVEVQHVNGFCCPNGNGECW